MRHRSITAWLPLLANHTSFRTTAVSSLLDKPGSTGRRLFLVSPVQDESITLDLIARVAGQGFVRLDEGEAKGLALPKAIQWTDPSKNGSFYGTAIVHSIHCLYSIMAEYDALALGLRLVKQATVEGTPRACELLTQSGKPLPQLTWF